VLSPSTPVTGTVVCVLIAALTYCSFCASGEFCTVATPTLVPPAIIEMNDGFAAIASIFFK